MQKETFEVEYEYEGERLDKYVSILFPEQSRSFFQKLIKDGNVSVNDKIQKQNYRLKTEDLDDGKKSRMQWRHRSFRKIYRLTFCTRMMTFWWSINQREWSYTHQQDITAVRWSMRLCITAGTVFPVSMARYVRESYTVLIWIPQVP